MICSLIRFCTEDARPTLDHNVLNVFELLKKVKAKELFYVFQ